MSRHLGHRPDRPPRVRPVPVSDGGTGSPVMTGRVRLLGWSLQNTAAAANTLAVKDNTTNSGITLVTVPIGASTFATQMPATPGVIAEIGLFALAGAASITGVLYVQDESEIGYGGHADGELGQGEAVSGGQGVSDVSGGVPAWVIPQQPGHG